MSAHGKSLELGCRNRQAAEKPEIEGTTKPEIEGTTKPEIELLDW